MYLSMTFQRTLNMTSPEHATRPVLEVAYHVRGFARESTFCKRPSASQWLAKVYAVPTA